MKLTVFYPQQMKLKSYYPRTVEENALDELKKFIDPEIEVFTDNESLQLADYEVLIAGRPTEEQLEASPKLRTVIIPWAGLSDQTSRLLENYPQLAVHNLHHNAVATGETAMMLLFAAAKKIIPIDQAFRKNDWRPRYQPNPAKLLEGKNLLVLGFGTIGQYVGRVCHAMGMQVNAVRRNPESSKSQSYPVKVYSNEELHTLLATTDVLMITVPLTKETKGMIGKNEIDLMPDQSILINVGRGLVVDQEALYTALKTKKLHSAGIDVWYNYPMDKESRIDTPPANFPFHELDNIVMSPHRGGGAKDIELLRMRNLALLLNAIRNGEEVPNKVNLLKGY